MGSVMKARFAVPFKRCDRKKYHARILGSLENNVEISPRMKDSGTREKNSHSNLNDESKKSEAE